MNVSSEGSEGVEDPLGGVVGGVIGATVGEGAGMVVEQAMTDVARSAR